MFSNNLLKLGVLSHLKYFFSDFDTNNEMEIGRDWKDYATHKQNLDQPDMPVSSLSSQNYDFPTNNSRNYKDNPFDQASHSNIINFTLRIETNETNYIKSTFSGSSYSGNGSTSDFDSFKREIQRMGDKHPNQMDSQNRTTGVAGMRKKKRATVDSIKGIL